MTTAIIFQDLSWFQISKRYALVLKMHQKTRFRIAGMLFAIIASLSGFAQTKYNQLIAARREEYKADFLKSAKSPLKQEDLQYLRFFEPDSSYRVEATVQRTLQAEPFDLPTYDGQKKPYVKYAVLTFILKGKSCQLTIYRSLQLARLPQYRDYLFLPFKDTTNGNETYGGGRYIDMRSGEIRDGKILLDFNKSYNPYCAYSDGYACPIPPKENHLPLAVEAGEKNYGKIH